MAVFNFSSNCFNYDKAAILSFKMRVMFRRYVPINITENNSKLRQVGRNN